MKRFVILLLLATSGLLLRAQTNTLPPDQQLIIDSEHGRFDGVARQMIYEDKVFVTDGKSRLYCEKLIVDLPPEGGHPTNIVALTNVVIYALDDKGQTNHITADKAVYRYHVVDSVTNSIITFTGGNPSPKAESSQFIIYGEPLTLDLITRQFSGEHYHMIFKQTTNSVTGTNSSPMNFLK